MVTPSMMSPYFTMPRDLGEDRHRERIPLGEELARLDRVAVARPVQPGAVGQAVALALAAGLVDDDELAVAVHDDPVVLSRLTTLDVLELDDAVVARLERRLLGADLTDAADVERTHRQLRARLADRLGGDDADRLADVDHVPAGEVAAVAQRRRCRAGSRR